MINEAALKELLGHLVFSHTFHTFDAKQAAEKALEELVRPDEQQPKSADPAPSDNAGNNAGQ